MLVDLEVFYLGHLKNLYTIQYNTMRCGQRTFRHDNEDRYTNTVYLTRLTTGGAV